MILLRPSNLSRVLSLANSGRSRQLATSYLYHLKYFGSTTTPPTPDPVHDDRKTTKATTTSTATLGRQQEPHKNSPPAAAATATAAGGSSLLPGLALAATTALGGFQIAAIMSSALTVPISGIPVSILLGMSIKNLLLDKAQRGMTTTASTAGAPAPTSTKPVADSSLLLRPGITYATKTVLQVGIVCVAAKLSFVELITTSTSSIPVVMASVGSGMLVLPWLGRLAGLPSQMTLLLTAGTSICGVTAITALAPAINAPNRDIAVAVANTVAFGTLGMLVYPYVFHSLCTSSEQVGICLGVAIHDTSQVLGSALAYKETYQDDVAFQVAAVTKLLRNLGLAVCIPALTYSYTSKAEATATATTTTTTTTHGGTTAGTGAASQASNRQGSDGVWSGLQTFTKRYVPTFLLAFIGMSAFRSGGDLLLHDVQVYGLAMNFIGNDLSKYMLGTAMAGVGLSTSVDSLRGVGWKPFFVGGVGALVVGGTGFTVASIMV